MLALFDARGFTATVGPFNVAVRRADDGADAVHAHAGHWKPELSPRLLSPTTENAHSVVDLFCKWIEDPVKNALGK